MKNAFEAYDNRSVLGMIDAAFECFNINNRKRTVGETGGIVIKC